MKFCRKFSKAHVHSQVFVLGPRTCTAKETTQLKNFGKKLRCIVRKNVNLRAKKRFSTQTTEPEQLPQPICDQRCIGNRELYMRGRKRPFPFVIVGTTITARHLRSSCHHLKSVTSVLLYVLYTVPYFQRNAGRNRVKIRTKK